MAIHIKLKEAFDVDQQFGAFYTGGIIAWTSDGSKLLCQNSGSINVISIENGQILNKIGSAESDEKSLDVDEDIIYTFALSNDEEHILTAHKSGLLKLWSNGDGVDSGQMIKMWKGSHKGPVSRLSFRSRSQIVASGGSDSSIRIWDYERKTCIVALRGSQGVIGILKFHPNIETTLIFASGDGDNKINCWNYQTKQLISTFSGHFSKITDISFTEDYNHFVSVSRDKVLILWDLIKNCQQRVIPLYEGLEGVCILSKSLGKLPNDYDLSDKQNDNKIYAAIAGESGTIKIWECTESKIIYSQTNSFIAKAEENGGLAITQLELCKKTNQLAVISADHNIIIYNLNTFHCSKQLIGFSDEILDICYVGKKGRYLAVATNSNDIKLYDTTNMNCKILKGHSDIVLSLSSFKNLILSSAKDNSIRVWELNTNNFTCKCVAKGNKHTASVGSVCFGRISHTICASVSQDTCLKTWEIPKKFADNDNDDTNVISLVCTNTVIAHEKDINCVAISPNDRIIATASQDKTAKLWSVNDLQLLGILRGHRRGIWCIRFSPVDQIILTTSADCTLRLWSLTDMSCLKSIEGHDSSILRAEFLSKGMQILSAGADGLLKIWTIKSNECVTTLDKHDSKIWTIAVSGDEMEFYSGGSDSQLIRWKDVTEEKKIIEFNERQDLILQEQELNNLISQKKMLKALKYALRLEKPNLTLKIINEVIKNQESIGLESTISELNDLHKENLLKHAVTWNTNSRNCRPAQLVLNILTKEILENKFKVNGLNKIVEESLPYTERHFKRMTEYLKDIKFIEFTLKCMQPYAQMDVDSKNDVK